MLPKLPFLCSMRKSSSLGQRFPRIQKLQGMCFLDDLTYCISGQELLLYTRLRCSKLFHQTPSRQRPKTCNSPPLNKANESERRFSKQHQNPWRSQPTTSQIPRLTNLLTSPLISPMISAIKSLSTSRFQNSELYHSAPAPLPRTSINSKYRSRRNERHKLDSNAQARGWTPHDQAE